MRRVLVTTTVNRPDNLMNWAEQLTSEDRIIVAGDLKTPHTEVTHVLHNVAAAYGVSTTYIHPHADENHEFQTHNVVGYNCIQRRNLAVLHALRFDDWDYIITVDDDNYPTTNWVTEVDAIFAGTHPLPRRTSMTSGWYNVGELCHPQVTHRGFPLRARMNRDADVPTTVTHDPTRVGVVASLWLGDPDIDAAERIVRDPHVYSVWGDCVLDADTWCPFNSQATAYRRELAPLLFMWPYVGRMDDIWSSLAARRVMDVTGWHAYYGRPEVRQNRNEHNLAQDLSLELIGYRHTDQLADILREIDFSQFTAESTIVDRARHMYSQLVRLFTVLPETTARSFSTWFTDLETVGVK